MTGKRPEAVSQALITTFHAPAASVRVLYPPLVSSSSSLNWGLIQLWLAGGATTEIVKTTISYGSRVLSAVTEVRSLKPEDRCWM